MKSRTCLMIRLMSLVCFWAFALALNFTAFGPIAHAISVPGWERPIVRSQLEIHQASGRLAQITDASLTVTRRDDSAVPTGLILTLDGETQVLSVIRAEKAGCGSVQYTASALARGAWPLQIIWIDHSQRLCRDLRPGIEGLLRLNGSTPELSGSLSFFGQLNPVYTIQSRR